MLKIFSLNGNHPLVEKTVKVLGIELGKSVMRQFSDGEISINTGESIRGDHVHIVQSTNAFINDCYTELLIMTDAMKRASAKMINTALPHYGYARQDRTVKPHGPIIVKLIASLIEEAGVTRVLILDLYTVQVQGFSDISVDNLFTMPLFVHHYCQPSLMGDDVTVVSPKNSDVQHARNLSEYLNSTLVVVDRTDDASTEGGYMIGDAQGKTCIMIDDILNTGATLIRAANVLKENGVKEVYACVSHGLLSDHTKSILDNAPVRDTYITDSAFAEGNCHPENLTIVIYSELVGEVVERIHENTPMSPLLRLEGKEFK